MITWSKGVELNWMAAWMVLDQPLNRKWSRRESLTVLSLIPKTPGKFNIIINTQRKLHQTGSISETTTELYFTLSENQEVWVLGLQVRRVLSLLMHTFILALKAELYF